MEPTARSLARTYSDRVYPDPWEKVEDYQRVQKYAAEHQDAGRTAVGNALELPPGRVRGWLDGAKPDPVRGIETASRYGWLDPECDMAGALVELLAHVLAGGSINEMFTPAITTGRRTDRAAIEAAFAAVGVDAQSRHADSDGRATELYPTTDASVLGGVSRRDGRPARRKKRGSTLSRPWCGRAPQRSASDSSRCTSHTGESTLRRRRRRASRNSDRRRISKTSGI